jgi:hypothetical protein
MPLPPGPSGGLLDSLYTAKDLGLKGRGKGSLGSLYLYFKKLHPPKRAIIW